MKRGNKMANFQAKMFNKKASDHPKISAGLAVVFLVVLVAYKYIKVNQKEVAKWRKTNCKKLLFM